MRGAGGSLRLARLHRPNRLLRTEGAQAMKEIKTRDPSFELAGFLRGLQKDIPKAWHDASSSRLLCTLAQPLSVPPLQIIQAYLKGDVELLKAHCSKEMVERLSGIIAALKAQGHIPDPTILYTSDVQLVDVKFLENEPIVVVQFACQQLDCVRDSFGNVVEGAADRIQQVHYAWALQQEEHGFVDEATGKWRPPRWQLREMLIRGAVPLI